MNSVRLYRGGCIDKRHLPKLGGVDYRVLLESTRGDMKKELYDMRFDGYCKFLMRPSRRLIGGKSVFLSVVIKEGIQ